MSVGKKKKSCCNWVFGFGRILMQFNNSPTPGWTTESSGGLLRVRDSNISHLILWIFQRREQGIISEPLLVPSNYPILIIFLLSFYKTSLWLFIQQPESQYSAVFNMYISPYRPFKKRLFAWTCSPAPLYFPGLVREHHRSSPVTSVSSFPELGWDSFRPINMST